MNATISADYYSYCIQFRALDGHYETNREMQPQTEDKSRLSCRMDSIEPQILIVMLKMHHIRIYKLNLTMGKQFSYILTSSTGKE
jgi:hypothetical protein